MLFAAPLSIILMLVIWAYLTRFAFAIERVPLEETHPARQALSGPKQNWTGAEVKVAAVFIMAVVLWVSRKYLLALLELPPKAITDATIAIGITVVLYMIPANRGRTRTRLLTWDETAKTPWQILILFGGGFALASGFKTTGLSVWLGSILASTTHGWALPIMVLSIVLFMTFLTEVTSNTATSIILLPIICELANASKVEPLILLLPATLAASCAFMLPVATPPNAWSTAPA